MPGVASVALILAIINDMVAEVMMRPGEVGVVHLPLHSLVGAQNTRRPDFLTSEDVVADLGGARCR